MNPLNVKVIHTGGTGPTLLIEKLKAIRSFLSWTGMMFIFFGNNMLHAYHHHLIHLHVAMQSVR